MSGNSLNTYGIGKYTADIEAVKEYYADLLILQYRNKPKARGTIKMYAEMFMADGLVFQLQDLLDIDSAFGAQLDIIGKILECPRTVHGIYADRQFFQFHESAQSLGFSTVGNPVNAVMKSIKNTALSIYTLEDKDYRVLLKYKAAVNVMRGALLNMDEVLESVFNGNVRLIDNQDLTITYILADNSMIAIAAGKSLGYFRSTLGINLMYILAVPAPGRVFGFNSGKNPINGTTIGFLSKNDTAPSSWLTRKNII